MAEVTNEMMFEVIEKLQADVAGIKDLLQEHAGAMDAIRTSLIGQSLGIQHIYSVLARHDARLGRIERRLEIVEPV
jgi:hypothetical protein